MALADQYAHHDLGFINPAIYSIARSSSYHKAFHDITTDNDQPSALNGYPAAPGWDPVTGWGTPNAQVLIPLLARFTSQSSPRPGPRSADQADHDAGRRAPGTDLARRRVARRGRLSSASDVSQLLACGGRLFDLGAPRRFRPRDPLLRSGAQVAGSRLAWLEKLAFSSRF